MAIRKKDQGELCFDDVKHEKNYRSKENKVRIKYIVCVVIDVTVVFTKLNSAEISEHKISVYRIFISLIVS